MAASMMPTRKVSVSALAGAVVVLLILILRIFAPRQAAQLDNASAAAATVIVSTVFAYLIPEADQA